ncbi:MAG: hypothetical protein QW548_02485 [Candidatus Aenigmatarchaeota archaeon]
MPWRWTNPDARPISEYLYDYHLARKAQRYLYYCRECVRNFDAKSRAERCPKCGQASIIELPKEATLERKRGAVKKPGLATFAKDAAKARKAFSMILAEAFENLKHALWRTKIAIYFALARLPDELR